MTLDEVGNPHYCLYLKMGKTVKIKWSLKGDKLNGFVVVFIGDVILLLVWMGGLIPLVKCVSSISSFYFRF